MLLLDTDAECVYTYLHMLCMPYTHTYHKYMYTSLRILLLGTNPVVAGSDEEEDNDNKSDKSDDDNDQSAKVKGESRDGSTPQPDGADPQPKSDGQEEEVHPQKEKKHSRQDWEARIAELPLRSEPVGLDRHHRKYWLLSGLSPQFLSSDLYFYTCYYHVTSRLFTTLWIHVQLIAVLSQFFV